MKWIIRVVVYATLIGTGIWLWLYFHPSPQEAIRRQLAQFAAAASFQGPEGLVRRAAAAQKFSRFFAGEVRVNIEPRGFFDEDASRQDIAEAIFQVRSQADIKSLRVQILDPVITLGADRRSAIVELTVNVETGGEPHFVVQEMKFTMRQVEKEWLIFRIETVRTLNSAPRQWPANSPLSA
jgi:hypothetical protein